MEAEDLSRKQQRFVALLRSLTETGVASWAQTPNEPGYIHCRLPQDLVLFEVLGPDGRAHVSPDTDVGGMIARFRNITLLFLPDLPEGEALLALLKEAPLDAYKFHSLKLSAANLPIETLESLAGDGNAAT